MNFNKLRSLISQYERLKELDKRNFFIGLKRIAETELRLKQESLMNFGG